jgi:hypothetical protein
MKALTIPRAIKCPPSLAPAGEISLASFVRELVLVRPAWRERGNASLLLEIDHFLDTPEGGEGRLSDEAHELLCKEASFLDDGTGRPVQLRWDMATTVAQFQQVLTGARSTKDEAKAGDNAAALS